MKYFIVLTAIVVVAQASPHSEETKQQWEDFKLEHGKQYENQDEENMRKQIFAHNLKTFEEHNKKFAAGLVSYTLGVNQFADMTPEEFAKTLTPMNLTAVTGGLPFIPPANINVPPSIDWREKGVVTPVKDQGPAGHATLSVQFYFQAGAVEGQLAIKSGKLVSLSEQNLLDCTSVYGNNGCGGGYPSICFEYIKKNGGIDREESYPYEDEVGWCRYNATHSGGTIRDFVKLPKGDENALQTAVATVGPISICLNAIPLQSYTGGVFDGDCNPKLIDHAVLAVGYGTTSDGQAYWIIKNSWGEKYGEHGYFRLARNKNQCGLTAISSYPVA